MAGEAGRGLAVVADEVQRLAQNARDATEQIARDWCSRNGKDFVFSDYKNEPATANWLHVDNFANARNQSFAQATGDWLMWADCDDLCSDAKKLRNIIELTPPDVVMMRFPYWVPQVATNTQRERIIALAGERYPTARLFVARPHPREFALDFTQLGGEQEAETETTGSELEETSA